AAHKTQTNGSQTEVCATNCMHFRRIVDGPFPTPRISDRRKGAKLFSRGRKALSHAARGKHRHSQAGGIGGPAAAGARRAPSETDRRRRIAARLCRAPAKSARRNPEGNGRSEKPRPR